MSNELHLLCWQKVLFSSVQSLIRVQIFATHGLQHAKLPRPSPTPGACSNWCLLSQWCHPTISSSVVPFSSCLQSFPASGSFAISQFFTSGGQSIGASALASVHPMNIQDWLPLGWTVRQLTKQCWAWHLKLSQSPLLVPCRCFSDSSMFCSSVICAVVGVTRASLSPPFASAAPSLLWGTREMPNPGHPMLCCPGKSNPVCAW